MNYDTFITYVFAGLLIIMFIAKIIDNYFDDSGFIAEAAMIIMVAVLFTLTLQPVMDGPNEKNCSKKKVLESQKIEAILDSNTVPVEAGAYREAVSKNHDTYKGVITYTSDKKLDKTYQKVRYYGSFFYNDMPIIYLYDPKQDLTKNE